MGIVTREMDSAQIGREGYIVKRLIGQPQLFQAQWKLHAKNSLVISGNHQSLQRGWQVQLVQRMIKLIVVISEIEFLQALRQLQLRNRLIELDTSVSIQSKLQHLER